MQREKLFRQIWLLSLLAIIPIVIFMLFEEKSYLKVYLFYIIMGYELFLLSRLFHFVTKGKEKGDVK